MELKQLQYLAVCAQTKSFTKAANTLYTAQSNVSKVIKTLEKELGFELFERKQYGIELTEKGKAVYEYAQITLNSAQKILEFSQQEHYELRISSNPSSFFGKIFCEYYLNEKNDQVHYAITTASTTEIIQRVAQGRDQLGFVYILEDQISALKDRLHKEHMYFTPLKNLKMMLYTKKGIEGDSIQNIDLVQNYDDEYALRSYWDESQGATVDVPINRIAVSTNSEYIMNELLRRTNLGNISGEYPNAKNQEYESRSLFGDQNPVVFGYISRNDQALERLAVQFLRFVKKSLEK